LLLRGLELPDPTLRANVVESLVAIVESEGESHGLDTITTHLGTLVAAMLRNTRGEQKQRSMVVSGVLLMELLI
jgi:DNA repair/transcription protein MET18/MMS19